MYVNFSKILYTFLIELLSISTCAVSIFISRREQFIWPVLKLFVLLQSEINMMKTMENVVCTPSARKSGAAARRSANKKRMSVDEYIALVRKALDKRYADL